MTEIGEAVSITSDNDNEDEVEDLFRLRFQLLAENGAPVKGIPYKTIQSGKSAEPLHIDDARTSFLGITDIVSTTENEEIDFYIVWAKLTINTSWIKT